MQDQSIASSAPTNEAQSEKVAFFVSDLHLQASMPRTTATFIDFLRRHATKARQLYLLGDLFEYWPGDDDTCTPFNRQIIDAIRAVSDTGVAVFWIAGNRDFLVGEAFAHACGLTLLPDPHVATIAGQRIVLTHGDAQCTDDHAYMAFRAQVRAPSWQQSFLAMPLAQRKAIIDGMRNGSREAQRAKSCEIMDVNADAIASLFDMADADTMIHGHTHRPARHEYGNSQRQRVRYVLPDWDCDAPTVRGGWITINADGAIERHDLADHVLE